MSALDPRRDDGHGRRLPHRPFGPDLRPTRRPRRRSSPSSARSRCSTGACALRSGRPEEGAGVFDRSARSATCSWPSAWARASTRSASSHLVGHGFFKAALFLSAGSVMHAMNDRIDMRRFGGLWQGHAPGPSSPSSAATSRSSASRCSPASGPRTRSSRPRSTRAGRPGYILGIAALLGAGLTAFYMTRALVMTFFGEKRWEDDVHPHEAPASMTVPMVDPRPAVRWSAVTCSSSRAAAPTLADAVGRCPVEGRACTPSTSGAGRHRDARRGRARCRRRLRSFAVRPVPRRSPESASRR